DAIADLRIRGAAIELHRLDAFGKRSVQAQERDVRELVAADHRAAAFLSAGKPDLETVRLCAGRRNRDHRAVQHDHVRPDDDTEIAPADIANLTHETRLDEVGHRDDGIRIALE